MASPEIRDLTTAFGEKLKRLRLERKLSMRNLANLANMELSQVYRIESGKAEPKLGTIFSLARALDMDEGDLIRLGKKPAS